MKKLDTPGTRDNSPYFDLSPHSDLDALLHPAQAFAHPRDVVADPDLTLNEKRAILAAWASDACAVEAAPALRRAPGSAGAVSIDAILAALQDLDRVTAETSGRAEMRRRQRTAAGIRSLWPPASDDPGRGLSP